MSVEVPLRFTAVLPLKGPIKHCSHLSVQYMPLTREQKDLESPELTGRSVSHVTGHFWGQKVNVNALRLYVTSGLVNQE